MGIYVVDGRDGRIYTGALPSGDLTMKGTGDDWFLATARSIAKANGGEWNGQYGNWIVPKPNKERAIDSLQTRCRLIG